MKAQRAVEIQAVLEGIPLPARRRELVEYAAHEDREAAALLARLLPDREFDRLDAVGEALTQPPRAPQAPQKLPVPESGKPPGGPEYLNPSPDSGRVRPSAPRTHPPKKVLQEQTKLQKKQQQRRES